jgi:hypothetical protein
MKNIFQEYKRLKKLARATEGKLGSETITSFLARIDTETLGKLQVSPKDLGKLKTAKPEARLQLLVPYFEKFIERAIEGKVNQKIQMGDKLSQAIARGALQRSGKIVLPQQPLLTLASMHPAAFIALQTKEKVFMYPLVKIKQILVELEQAEISWELKTNTLKIFSADKQDRFACVLFAQDPYTVNGKPKFFVKISQVQNTSITDLLVKAVEAVLGT